MFTLSWTEIKSAFIYTLLTALVVGGYYIVSVESIYNVNGKVLLDKVAMSIIVGTISLFKNLLTSSKGKFLNLVKVK